MGNAISQLKGCYLHSENDKDVIGFKGFKIDLNNKSIKSIGLLFDYLYKFNKNGYTIVNNKKQNMFFTLQDRDRRPILCNTEMNLGYHISPFLTRLPMHLSLNKYGNSIYYYFVKFKQQDIQFFDGEDVIVKQFKIITNKKEINDYFSKICSCGAWHIFGDSVIKNDSTNEGAIEKLTSKMIENTKLITSIIKNK